MTTALRVDASRAVLGGAFLGGASRFAATVTAQIPMLKPYRYAKLGKRLLIVNPDDRKIVDIISPWKIVDAVRPSATAVL